MFKRSLVIVLCIFFANNAWGNTPLKVAVFPFMVNSDEQLDYLEEGIADMLSTRMEQDQAGRQSALRSPQPSRPG